MNDMYIYNHPHILTFDNSKTAYSYQFLDRIEFAINHNEIMGQCLISIKKSVHVFCSGLTVKPCIVVPPNFTEDQVLQVLQVLQVVV